MTDVIKLAAEASRVNPFSDRRHVIDGELAGLPADHPDVLSVAVQKVGEALDRADRDPKTDRTFFFAVLFEAFHLFLDDFDRLIAKDLKSSKPPKATFVEVLVMHLVGRGIDETRSFRIVELFYQMVRAHRFLGSSLQGSGLGKTREKAWNTIFTHDIELYEAFLWKEIESFSTLIIGQTGTGKSRVAKAIGQSGFIPFDRDKTSFSSAISKSVVSLNPNEFAETLLESELFGHEKGAFTGAVQEREGWLARCPEHGTLFLDEIGEISPAIQIKLLRVLQERRFSPVGGHREKRFRGRVIAATHRSIDVLRQEKRFRDDFYFRLRTNVLEIPSLRQQLDADLVLCDVVASMLHHIEHGLVKHAEHFSELIEKTMPKKYAWPGNFRELEQALRHLLLHGVAPAPSKVSEPLSSWQEQAAEKELALDQVSAAYLKALRERAGSLSKTAEIAQLDRRTVQRYLQWSK